ncbi:MAG: hypothetical protein ACR2N3_10355 [Pyrinomonadaceae bacterium]
MQDVQTIYRQTILPLPASEKLRLATIILQDLSDSEKPQVSALDLLQSLPDEKVFSSPDEVNEHLKAERESWDS